MTLLFVPRFLRLSVSTFTGKNENARCHKAGSVEGAHLALLFIGISRCITIGELSTIIGPV